MRATWLARCSGVPLLWIVLVATLPFVTPKIRASDEIECFAHLRSLVFDGDLEFGNEYQHFYDQDPQGLADFKGTFLDRREPRTGRHINFAPIGSALLWLPAYLLAHGAAVASRALGFAVAADGFSRPYALAVCLASVAYGFAGLLLIHRALRRFASVPEPAASWTVAAVWLATPVLYHMTLATAFSHACSLFAVSLLLFAWLRWREDWSPLHVVAIGALAGLAGLVREQDLAYLALPALDLALRSFARRQFVQGAIRLALMVSTAVAALVPQLLVYRTLNGSFGPSSLVARKMNRFASPHFFEVLFDPGHGLFVWSPILAVATLGLVVWVVRRRAAVPALLLLGLLAQMWVNGAVESWHMAGAFGARRFVGATFIFAWGLAYVLTPLAVSGRRWLGLTLLALFVWWNLSLMVQFALRMINSEGSRQHLEWPRVAANQVTEVPRRLGRVGILFFSDRERLLREIREAR